MELYFRRSRRVTLLIFGVTFFTTIYLFTSTQQRILSNNEDEREARGFIHDTRLSRTKHYGGGYNEPRWIDDLLHPNSK